MGFLDRAIKSGISKAVSSTVANAVEQKVSEVLAPKVNKAVSNAANAVNESVNAFNQTSGHDSCSTPQNVQVASSVLGGTFASLAGAAQSFADEAAKNMKICPECGEASPAENKFCQSCGSSLPEMTIAEGAVCTSCGKQNSAGMTFCAQCGAKLPSALTHEQAVFAKWDAVIPQYPKWSFGGNVLSLVEIFHNENGSPVYALDIRNTNYNALTSYKQLLLQNGFRPAGQYPSNDKLYSMINGICYYFDACEPFPTDEGCLSVMFGIGEPSGGFNYVKPEPPKPKSFRDLLSL